MIERGHNIEPKEGIAQSAVNIQMDNAKSLPIDRVILAEPSKCGMAFPRGLLQMTYETDRHRLLARVQEIMRRNPAPSSACTIRGQAERIIAKCDTESIVGNGRRWRRLSS